MFERALLSLKDVYEYVDKSCSNYANTFFKKNLTEIATSCRKIHPRGVNVIFVPDYLIGETITPTKCVELSRCFLDYKNGVQYLISLNKDRKWLIKQDIKRYNPETEILFLFIVSVGSHILLNRQKMQL
jgi:hypothetical protein